MTDVMFKDDETTEKTESVRLTGIAFENIMGMQATDVEINPDTHAIIVSGKNGAGKSRFISTVPIALGLDKVEVPITQGRKAGRVMLRYDGDKKLEIERRFSKTSPRGILTVKVNGEGIKRPQQYLDALMSPVVVKPMEFHEHYTDKQRLDFLYEVMGNKDAIETLGNRYKEVYDNRRDNNRDIANLKGKLDSAPADDGTKEVSFALLFDQREQELERMRKLNELVADKKALDEAIENFQKTVDANNGRIIDLQQEILELRQTNLELTVQITAAEENMPNIQKQIDEFPESGVAEIQEQIDTAGETNTKARAIAEANQVREEVSAFLKKTDKMTQDLDAIQQEKMNLLNDANIPIKGLTIEDGSILIDGLPWAQQSTAEGILNAMKLANMRKATIRNMILDWDHLDSNSRKIVLDFATEHNYTMLVELVSDDKTDISTHHMEDGKVEVV